MTLPTGGDPGRLRVLDPHRGRAPLHRRTRERAAGAARLRRCSPATPARSSRARSRARARAATGCSSSRRPGRGRRSASGSRASGASTRSTTGTRRPREGAAPRRSARAEAARTRPCSRRSRRASTTSTSKRCTPRSAKVTCRPRPWCNGCSASCAAARTSCRSPCSARLGPAVARTRPAGVHVEGLDDVMVRLSRCCTPVPGDEIMGFVTRGPRRLGAPHRLRQRAEPDEPGRPGHRGRVGPRRARHLRGRRRDRGARPLEAPPGRRRGALGAPREHPVLHHRRPSPTASPGCGSSSSSPTRTIWIRSCGAVKRVGSVYDAARVLPGGHT